MTWAEAFHTPVLKWVVWSVVSILPRAEFGGAQWENETVINRKYTVISEKALI